MEQKKDHFLTLYRRLNPSQKEAVDTIEGPVMVVAGPGTGKTQILTLRIANILRQTDTAPDSILALTFTTAGVHAMRRRLVTIIGSAGYRVNIHTFHGFCNEVINKYPEEFPRIIGSSNATSTDQIKILEELITELPLTLLKPFGDPFYHLYSILSEIEKLKKENLTPNDFTKLIIGQEKDFKKISDLHHEKGAHKGKMKGKYIELQKDIAKNRELAQVYEAYEEKLRTLKLYDFSDMIMEVVRALGKDKEFLWRLQEQYQYLLADEHQDVNQSQNKLLELLANFYPDPNLFIVGDEKQAIFQFQGASLDNFNYFKKLYPQAKLVALADNYRSSQTILDSSHSLITKSGSLPAEILVALKAQVIKEKAKIKLHVLPTAETEGSWLAKDIKRQIESGAVANEIAVLYRDNKDAAMAAEALAAAGVPVVIQSDTDILSDIEIQKLLVVFEAIHGFGDDYYLSRLLQLDFLNFDSLEVYKLLSGKGNLYQALQTHPHFKDFYTQLEKWHRASQNQNLVEWFGNILEESGFVPYLLTKPEAVDKLAKLQSFYQEIKDQAMRPTGDKVSRRVYKLGDFMEYLELAGRHNLRLNQKHLPALEGVRLMTAHKSKGLEFDHVYIINAFDGHWGNKRRGGGFKIPWRGSDLATEPNDDERRLFYVALTRARYSVDISYALADSSGRQYLPSQFIEEIDGDYLEAINHEVGSDVAGLEAEQPWRRGDKSAINLDNKAYLNKLFEERGLSATALNNYLDCPLKYFFHNLLRLTQVQNRHLLYGTAMHETLRHYFDRYREEEDLEPAATLEYLKRQLEQQPFSPNDLSDAWEKGQRSLTGYLEFYKGSWSRTIINEFGVRGVLLGFSGGAGSIKLTGKIDKMELLSNSGEVRVIDYKTGKPKSKNWVLGLTKTSDGNYRRQLLFYRLLLDNYGRPATSKGAPKYRATYGLIDFIEPDDKGRLSQVEMPIEEGEVKELANQIQEVASEIRDLSFFTKGCNKKDCDACRLWSMTGK